MKLFSNINNFKAFISTKMIDVITFLDKNGKYSVYTGENTHGIYSYL